MTELQFWKEGILTKAGKHSFQGWRKRWFILNSDSLKYFNLGTEYNESNLLGNIQLIEIQSLVAVKSPKYAFDIITKARTYNLAAKSDMERDDWIITLQKASDERRGMNFKRQSVMSTKIDSVDLTGKDTKRSSSQKDKSSKKESKKSKSKSVKSTSSQLPINDEDNFDDSVFSTNLTAITAVSDYEKIRASTLREGSITDETFDSKPRSVSLADSLTRVNSTLRKMSTLDDNGEVENIYQALEKELDQGGDSEASDDETDHPPQTNAHTIVEFPPPRNGCEKYAFHEIKEMLNYDESSIRDIDLKKISKDHSLEYNESEDFIAFSLLKSYIASH